MKDQLRPKTGIRVLTTFLCLLLFLSLVAGIAVVSVRIVTTKENTSKIIRESLFDAHSILPSAGHAGVSGGHGSIVRNQPRLASPKLEEESTTGIMTDMLVEMIYGVMEEEYGELPISQEEVEQFIEESTFDEALADISASLVSDMITGENTTVIGEETITDLFMDNADLIEDYFGVAVEEEAVSQMAATIVQSDIMVEIQEKGISQVLVDAMGNSADLAPDGSENIGGEVSDTVDTVNQMAETLDQLRSAISVGTMIACFAVAAVCIAVICIINRKYIWYALRRIGVATLWASLPGLLVDVAILNSADALAAFLEDFGFMVNAVALITQMILPVSIAAVAVGVVLVIVGIVLRAQAKKKLLAAKNAPVVEVTPTVEEIPAVEETPAIEEPATEIAEEPADETVEEVPAEIEP